MSFEQNLIGDCSPCTNGQVQSSLVQEMGWRRQGAKPISEAMLTKTPDAKWRRSDQKLF